MVAAKKKTAVKSSGVEVAMVLARETKNTFRFEADDEDAAITTLYVNKSAFPNGAPENVTITVA